VLLSKQIESLAEDLARDAAGRPYVKSVIPALAGEPTFWNMVLEMVEIALNRHGYVVVQRDHVVMNPPDHAVSDSGGEDYE
jgi:hypothetical protein